MIPDKMEEPETGSELLKTTEVPTDAWNECSPEPDGPDNIHSMPVGPLLPRAAPVPGAKTKNQKRKPKTSYFKKSGWKNYGILLITYRHVISGSYQKTSGLH